jgi:hypothetical protein
MISSEVFALAPEVSWKVVALTFHWALKNIIGIEAVQRFPSGQR